MVAGEQGSKGGGEMSSGRESGRTGTVGRQLPARTFSLTPGLYREKPSPISVSRLLNPDMMVSRVDRAHVPAGPRAGWEGGETRGHGLGATCLVWPALFLNMIICQYLDVGGT